MVTNVLSNFFQSFRISGKAVFSIHLLAGIFSIFFYGIWENIDSWKVIVAVLFFGYAAISLALQMSRRSRLEKILCEAQRRSYLWYLVLKNILRSLLFWLGLSVLWILFSILYNLSTSDVVLLLTVCVLLFVSEFLAVFGIVPRNPSR